MLVIRRGLSFEDRDTSMLEGHLLKSALSSDTQSVRSRECKHPVSNTSESRLKHSPSSKVLS